LLAKVIVGEPKTTAKKGVLVGKLQLKITITDPLIFFIRSTAKGNVGECPNILF
jgi:hypothetical protein